MHQVRPLFRDRAGFTLLEILVVVIVLGILAAVVTPRFTNAQSEARGSALQAAVGGVRSGLAAYRTRATIAGIEPFPTLEELVSPGVVTQSELPVNPYNGLRTVQSVTLSQALARSVSGEESFGWNYFVDNATDPPVAIFYANSSAKTGIIASDGVERTANEL
ncbi:MAG: prepilin-type N-terminal cleavage/methylation domain-containing protein [Phycisphaeraceae bacterium]|nr:prepilin-type N-terminal cleavage/methylation domain-containing protein [Phycisphaeraceae bacterium]